MNHFPNKFPQSTNKADNSQHEVRDNQQRIANLEKEVAELSMLVEGLWNLLQSNSQLSDDNLREAIGRVVEEKNKLKDKKRGCKTCARFVSAQYKKCIYCGGELVGNSNGSIFS